MDYIKQVAQMYVGEYLNFIAVLEDTGIIAVIKQISSIDENSKKSTNIRHWSTWVIFHHLQVYQPIESRVEKFDNMAIIYLRDRTDERVSVSDVMTLLMTNCGVRFYPVDMSRDEQLFPNINYKYNGRHFNVITKTWKSFIEEEYVNGTPVYKGYIADILDSIAIKLNFTYSFYNDPEISWTGYVKGTNTSMFYKVVNGEYDIKAYPSAVSEEKMKHVDYVFPAYFTDKVIPTYWKRPVSSSFLLYTKPFQIVVLVGILLCFIYFCCFLRTLERINPCNRGKQIASLKEQIFHIVGIIVHQGGMLKIDSLTGRLSLASFWIFCIIMGSVYKGNLVAFFTRTNPVVVFNSLGDILDSDYRLGIMANTTLLDQLKNHSIPDYKRLQERLNANIQLHPEMAAYNLYNDDVHISHLLAGNYVYFAGVSCTSFIYANNCDVIRLQTVAIYDLFYAFGVPMKSPLKHELETTMNELQQTGLIEKWQRKWWPERRKDFCNAPLRVKQLHLSDIYNG
ncbi:glutamate receptor ionotropic, kainate 2 [Patella vulgata]|uniref:glutamate receptor ionotropic, kainate 2 n=1 Tax=Patella vulgata TaxID=6465 RepID=UPI0024A81A83|nr:glutamate receptor ionotropic, kainate 2 [Patella vulgata]